MPRMEAPSYLIQRYPPIWKPSNGLHSITIIPFVSEDGELEWYKEISVHFGPCLSDAFCCLQDMWGEPCPICDYLNLLKRHRKTSHERSLLAWRKRKKVLYYIIVLDTKREKEEGVRILNISHYTFHRILLQAVESFHKKPTLSSVEPDLKEVLDYLGCLYRHEKEGKNHLHSIPGSILTFYSKLCVIGRSGSKFPRILNLSLEKNDQTLDLVNKYDPSPISFYIRKPDFMEVYNAIFHYSTEEFCESS
jgi:hypothetical protein